MQQHKIKDRAKTLPTHREKTNKYNSGTLKVYMMGEPINDGTKSWFGNWLVYWIKDGLCYKDNKTFKDRKEAEKRAHEIKKVLDKKEYKKVVLNQK